MAIQDARIRELADDTAEELKAIRQEIKDLRIHVDQGFNQAHAYIQEHIESVMATKQDISELKELIKQLIPYKSDE
ncbi:MAG: hypothetical protein ACJ788_19720 [Ktedonobacteraceae bacterium]